MLRASHETLNTLIIVFKIGRLKGGGKGGLV